jgi:hypothetical protein
MDQYSPMIGGQPFDTPAQREALMKLARERADAPLPDPPALILGQTPPLVISREMLDWRQQVKDAVARKALIQFGNDPVIAHAIAEDSREQLEREAEVARQTLTALEAAAPCGEPFGDAERCPDGGTCHHACPDGRCHRKDSGYGALGDGGWPDTPPDPVGDLTRWLNHPARVRWGGQGVIMDDPPAPGALTDAQRSSLRQFAHVT